MAKFSFSISCIALRPAAAALALFPSVLSAEQSEVCNKEGLLAESAMLLRQHSKLDLGKILDGTSGEPRMQEYLLSAWEYPLMLTNETKKISINEFKSAAILKCYRGDQ